MTAHEADNTFKVGYIQLKRNLNALPSGLTELTSITEDDMHPLAEQPSRRRRGSCVRTRAPSAPPM